MIDRADYVCHRMKAAQATNQSYRGWDFSRAVDESPIWIRALAETFRPRSLVILAVIGFTLSLFWMI
jgi:hypothetical protein